MSLGLFEKHLTLNHHQSFDAAALQNLADTCARRNDEPETLKCVLCSKEYSNSKRLNKHLSHHLEQLTLFALPKDLVAEDSDEDQSNASLGSMERGVYNVHPENNPMDVAPPGLELVRALYDFVGEDEKELSFFEGDVIQVISRLESGWWDGALNGVRGWFPSNYCVAIPHADDDHREADMTSDDESDTERFTRRESSPEAVGTKNTELDVDQSKMIETLNIIGAIRAGNIKLVQSMLSAGLDANMVFHKESLLHMAAKYGHPDIVALLLSRGVDINAQYLGRTALTIATNRGHEEVAQLLKNYGATLPKSEMSRRGGPISHGDSFDEQHHEDLVEDEATNFYTGPNVEHEALPNYSSTRFPKVEDTHDKDPVQAAVGDGGVPKVTGEVDSEDVVPAPIRYTDAVGRKFVIPWSICRTWRGMESMIKQAVSKGDALYERVHEGQYYLLGPDGAIVLPQVWDSMVHPGWDYTMQMMIATKPSQEAGPSSATRAIPNRKTSDYVDTHTPANNAPPRTRRITKSLQDSEESIHENLFSSPHDTGNADDEAIEELFRMYETGGTYTRIRKKYLDYEVLRRLDLPYKVDEDDPSWILILRAMSKSETDALHVSLDKNQDIEEQKRIQAQGNAQNEGEDLAQFQIAPSAKPPDGHTLSSHGDPDVSQSSNTAFHTQSATSTSHKKLTPRTVMQKRLEREFKRGQEELRERVILEKRMGDGRSVDDSSATSAKLVDRRRREDSDRVFPKIHKQYLDVETLRYYDIPYELAKDDHDYIIILRYMARFETDLLFEHTRRLRDGTLLPLPGGEQVRDAQEGSGRESPVVNLSDIEIPVDQTRDNTLRTPEISQEGAGSNEIAQKVDVASVGPSEKNGKEMGSRKKGEKVTIHRVVDEDVFEDQMEGDNASSTRQPRRSVNDTQDGDTWKSLLRTIAKDPQTEQRLRPRPSARPKSYHAKNSNAVDVVPFSQPPSTRGRRLQNLAQISDGNVVPASDAGSRSRSPGQVDVVRTVDRSYLPRKERFRRDSYEHME
nr:endophilin-a1 [Quercus suber]